MIYLKVADPEFYDDAIVLVRSFYPRREVKAWESSQKETEENGQSVLIEPVIPDKTGKNRKEFHEEFKEQLYRMLQTKTGQSLPWGYLTGVRPSKIAYQMLEDGASRERILQEFTGRHLVSEKKAQLAYTVAQKERQILQRKNWAEGYSLYVGIPFCPTTCLYCSFTSYSLKAYRDKTDAYLDALILELSEIAQMQQGRRLDTVYFGGGTPTTLEPAQLDRLLTALEEHFPMEQVGELTVEAGRPDSITPEKLQILKKHQVGRISINPQTMNQETLDLIGRRHTVEQVQDAFAMAREAGFHNINMDMILGLPGEDKDMVRHTLDCVRTLQPESLTVHSLAIKRAAALNIWREKYAQLELVNSSEIVDMTAECAAQMGLEPYYMYRQKNMTGNFENVGYSKPGLECLYNILIMEEQQTILAAGAGASSKFVFPQESDTLHRARIERVENVKNVDQYISRIGEMIARKRDFLQSEAEKNKKMLTKDILTE